MNREAALKKKVMNPNKGQSPMKKNSRFDFQFRSSAELAKQYKIKRENLANEHKDKAGNDQQHKRKNTVPTTVNARERQSMQRSITSEESVQNQVMSNKLPMHKSMIQSSPREGLNMSLMIERTQGEGETQSDVQEVQNSKKVKRTPVLPAMDLNNFLEKQGKFIGGEIQQVDDGRSMPSPLVDRNNVELDDIPTHEEVGEDVWFGHKAMDIDCAKGTSEKSKMQGGTTSKMIGANERHDKVVNHQAQPLKRSNPMHVALNNKGQSMLRSSPCEKSIQKQMRSKLSMNKSMAGSSSKEDFDMSHIIGRTQEGGEKEHDIQEVKNTNKVKRKSALPAMGLSNFLDGQGILVGGEKQPDIHPDDEGDVAMHKEVDEDECFVDEAMDIDSAKGTSEKKKVRGRTTCKKIHARNFEEREDVTFDKGQAVGPTDKRVSDLSNFLGTIARNPRFITLLYTSWKAVPRETKQRMWEYVNSKFIIPAEGKKWVMDGLRDAWKRYKRRVKKNHFDGYNTIEDMLENRPTEIPEVQFRQLVEYWKLPAVQAMCHLNSQNRKKQKWRHRMGPVNFGRVRLALRAKNNEEPSKSEMFIATRTKGEKQVDTDTQEAIEELLNRQNSGETADDAFLAVFGKEQPGRVRCYGRSVTTSYLKKDEEIIKLKQKHADEVTSMKEEMQELKEEVHELRKLQELKEEMEEFKKWKDFMKVLVKTNPGLNIPDVAGCIGSNPPSPVDASSGHALRGQNLPHSSGSTHSPIHEKENFGDAIRTGGRKSIGSI